MFENEYDEIASRYPETEIVYNSIQGMLRKEFVLKYLGSMKGSLLEVGCNTGDYLKSYDRGPVTGIDISCAIIDKAKKNVPWGNFLVGDGSKLPFEECAFRNILCSEVLEHVLNPEEFVKDFYRIQEYEGILLITTPNYIGADRPTWVEFDIYKKYGLNIGKIFHTAYNPLELTKMVEDVGYSVLEYGTLEQEALVLYYFVAQINRYTKRFLNKQFFKNIYEIAAEQILNAEQVVKVNNFEKRYYATMLRRLLHPIFKLYETKYFSEGPRSYILAKKDR